MEEMLELFGGLRRVDVSSPLLCYGDKSFWQKLLKNLVRCCAWDSCSPPDLLRGSASNFKCGKINIYLRFSEPKILKRLF